MIELACLKFANFPAHKHMFWARGRMASGWLPFVVLPVLSVSAIVSPFGFLQWPPHRG